MKALPMRAGALLLCALAACSDETAPLGNPDGGNVRDATLADRPNPADVGPDQDADPDDREGAPDGDASDTYEPDTGTTPDAGDAGEADCGITCQIHPDCAERGGECTLVSGLNDPCPAGTYNPFSGLLASCPTGALRWCCVPSGGFGAPCDDQLVCDNGSCLSETSGYPTGGLCSGGVCDPNLSGVCPSFSVCMPVFFSAAPGLCMIECESNDHCREDWSCQPFPVDPFGPDRETRNLCWQATQQAGQLGLGSTCTANTDCLSAYCLTDPADGVDRCTGTCDATHPCLPNHTCVPEASCTTPGCGTCFPS